ncbi:phosphoenolpyruvate carboxylase [Dysgonomonas sp. Marseille-P4677]|uniref:phosphoenolpyruvate carboxylase n=1 Tax=Dysgonomonas sp. Marseille-P4677 TaxID=2364790 RepID=UPI001914C640|nr:phosphoenolpyruvate carboxylase [Dysgonomonas sp. Marseille-P4677]MBK5723052.1 phosphoenolpyruvate carboxylase [Dysgonomonas sp. Marseille-P4677]
MNNLQQSLMHDNIKLLGDMLGKTISEAKGQDMLELIETIRRLSKASHSGDIESHKLLVETLQNLKDEEFLPVARSFNQFLNLTNTAEQYNSVSPHSQGAENPVNFSDIYKKLKASNIKDEDIIQAIENISIDLVLTAHPTEINRRSLINNLNQVDHCLALLDHDDLADYQKVQILRRLKQLIAQYWYTDEIRQKRPTPNEEAKWGYEVVENSLWQAVPVYIRELDEQIKNTLNYRFPINARPIHFSSWMGGDRDGNPNVTAKVTHEVLLDSRKRAAKLFLEDIEILVKELSMATCTIEFRDYIKDYEVQEPYRELMKRLRTRLNVTIAYIDKCIEGKTPELTEDILIHNDQLWEPLHECYKSLVACKMEIIADDKLLDTMRRVCCFGLTLTQLDIRQESTVHTEALSEITKYLGLGDYETWSEEEKQAFLLKELNSKRPLIPHNWEPSPQTKEVLDTCRVIAETPVGAIPTYVISMTRTPSDILAVYLLLKEAECPYTLPVTPLFETLNDLNNANGIMQQLFNISWYRDIIENKQMIMIGYSDSSKDAGSLAAGWAQYHAQEALIKTCQDASIALTLFHGRGGTVGRGGGPAKVALFSQPPGSLKDGLRVTEQGEMIRFKLGLPDLAIRTLSLYTDAILEANLLPPPAPKQEWRDLMDELSDISCKSYQGLVHKDPNFIPYFYQATPEAELARLPLGSRPAKRRPNGGVESLRAIPWIFGWTQNRLMLPAWLGAGEALQCAIDEGKMDILKAMYTDWPFFGTRISMLEMVFAKADSRISQYYDERLVEPDLLRLGKQLRAQLESDIKTILRISQDEYLMESLPDVAENIAMRNIYTNPLNLLQVELLHRTRKDSEHSSELELALMITISGIAAGMRNTG